MNGEYRTLDEFWPFYVSQHLNPTNRRLHFAGTTAGLLIAARALRLGEPLFVLAALVSAYGAAWVGHFVFERNRPATFRYPLLSFRADFRMYGLMWRGAMDAEIERLAPRLRALRGA